MKRSLLLIPLLALGITLAGGMFRPAPASAMAAPNPAAIVASSAQTSTSPDCDASGVSLSWVLCPVFDMLSDFSHWMFQNIVQPFLVTPPISTDAKDPSFQIWSNFRVYGDIFLIIGLLVIVFGQSIGGGLIDAYTAKKVLPRLLAAAILINLSIYIVAFLVDFTNILGRGISDVMTAPLANCSNGAGGNCWSFKLSNGDMLSIFGVGLVGLLTTSTAVFGLIAAIVFNPAFIGTALLAGFLVMVPIVFAILGVFITLIFRQGLILLLVLVSPVAFALYCLPNTEKYFRKWWELLVEALMVYPIIVLIFGAADIMSVTILQANHIQASDLSAKGALGGADHGLAVIVAFLLQFLPLLAIPFAFRFASGTLRRVYEAATTAGQKVQKASERRREQAKMDYKAGSYAARARGYHAANAFGEKHQGPLGIGRRASRFAARRAGGYNIEALMSEGRAQKMKQVEDQIATGRDEEIRGLTVNKASALSRVGAVKDNNGNWREYNAKTKTFGDMISADQLDQYDWQAESESGPRKFQSLGGAWVNEQDVDAGQRRWGNDQFAQQAALSYEMRKGITDNQRQRIMDKYEDVSTGDGGWNMTKGEAYGSWIGAAFANQNTNLQYKYANKDLTSGKQEDKFDHKGFVTEVYQKKGTYPLSQMDAGTIEKLRTAHQLAIQNGDPEMKQQLEAVADTFSSRMPTGQPLPGGQGDDQVFASGAAGAVQQQIQDFVKQVNEHK